MLVNGKREDDLRANKLGWNAWPWPSNEACYIQIGVLGVKQKAAKLTRWAQTYDKAFDLDDQSHFIGKLKEKGLFAGFRRGGMGRHAKWGTAPKRSILWITNQVTYSSDSDWTGDNVDNINPNNSFSHYLIFSNYTTQEINEKFIKNNNCQNLAELVGKLNGVLVRIGPDALELMESQTQDQKDRSQDEDQDTKNNTKNQVSSQDIKDLGLTPEEWEALKTAFTDPAKLANILKKIAKANPHKVAQMLDKMFDTIHPKTAEAIFKQMVNHNPVFTNQEKEQLIQAYQQAKTKADKKKLWQAITSGLKQRQAHQTRTPSEREQIFTEQVNNNPRYGSIGVDTQARRDRMTEYQNSTNQEQLQREENDRFTTGENANQWGNYFQDNAQREAGAGDRTVGTESDNNFNGQFSFLDSLNAINRLKNIGSMKPAGMEEGMVANKPAWQVVFNHPLTYIFLFIGIIIAIMAAATKKR